MLHLRLSYLRIRPSLLEQEMGEPRLSHEAARVSMRTGGVGEAKEYDTFIAGPSSERANTARLLVWGNGYVATWPWRRHAESGMLGGTGSESVGASECTMMYTRNELAVPMTIFSC